MRSWILALTIRVLVRSQIGSVASGKSTLVSALLVPPPHLIHSRSALLRSIPSLLSSDCIPHVLGLSCLVLARITCPLSCCRVPRTHRVRLSFVRETAQGEVTCLSGSVRSRPTSAYVAQTAWIQNMTVKGANETLVLAPLGVALLPGWSLL